MGRVSVWSAHVPGLEIDVTSFGLELAAPSEFGPPAAGEPSIAEALIRLMTGPEESTIDSAKSTSTQ